MSSVAVVDYGMGNLRSVWKALEAVADGEHRITVTGDPAAIARAGRVVFPGQGAIRDCMAEIDTRGLRPSLVEALEHKPFLGICMGLQALMGTSEEDPSSRGLSVLGGEVRRFATDARDPDTGERLKVPHMGWNRVQFTCPHVLWDGLEVGERFYFVHSYYVSPSDPQVIAATCDYGLSFVCAVARENLFAVQFHPEKSQHAGLRLLRNFLGWRP